MIKRVISYLFLGLFLNISFASYYEVVIGEIKSMELLEMVMAEEENHSEEGKSSSEVDKEITSILNSTSSILLYTSENNFSYSSDKLIVFHPERETPPPQIS